MRTWGRVAATLDNYTGDPADLIVDSDFPHGYVWQEVTTDANGYDDAIWLTTLAQVLQLGLNESPMFANYGIPAQSSVFSQIYPDYYVSQMQQKFSVYFLSVLVSRLAGRGPRYRINTVTKSGAIMPSPVPV